jgi:hypothetical protein
MRLYRYTIKNNTNNTLDKSGTGNLFDLEAVIPIKILSILELYANEKQAVSLQVQAGNLTYTIHKIQ